jgi:uncharacterized protein (TIGR00730 family)
VLAEDLVARNISIVYGGSSVGLMGVLAEAAIEAGGDVIGVITSHLVDKEVAHKGLSSLKVVQSMHERKALMADLSDGFIALPGGYGTLEEFCETLTWTQLGLHRKPCGLLNTGGYYDRLLAFLDHAVTQEFLKPAHRGIVISDTSPKSLVDRLLEFEMPQIDKWISRAV